MPNAPVHRKTDVMSQPRQEQSFELRTELQVCLFGKDTLYNSVFYDCGA